MNKIIINSLSSLKFNYGTKLYLLHNPLFFEDIEYIKILFEKSCYYSNLELVIFLYENCYKLQECDIKINYYNDLFEKICTHSDLKTLKWYLDKFQHILDMNNLIFIKTSLTNPDTNVFNFILENSNYSKKIYENMFLDSIINLNIGIAQLIYQKRPNINFKIINGIQLKNGIQLNNCDSKKSIVKWLKIILEEQAYILEVFPLYYLYVIDELCISHNEPILNNFSNISINYDNYINSNECIICFQLSNDIILNCSHKYCSYCIRRWLKKNDSCPTCRNTNELKAYYLK